MKLCSHLPRTCGLAFLCGVASAQSFNIDIGQFEPSQTYGGAAASPGYWNSFGPAGSSLQLFDLAGTSTAATLSLAGGVGQSLFDHPNTFGDDELLLDDFGALDPPGGTDTATWTFTGLTPGRYEVFVYAWRPDAPFNATNVAISSGNPCVEVCGGADWTGVHVLGQTYVTQTSYVTNGTLTITTQSSSGAGGCNAIQIEQSTSTQGIVLAEFEIDSSIEPNPLGMTMAHKFLWVSGKNTGTPANPRIHQFTLDGSFVQTFTTADDEGNDVPIDHAGPLAGGLLASPPPYTGLVPFDDLGYTVYVWDPNANGGSGGLLLHAAFSTDGKTFDATGFMGTYWGFDPNGNLSKFTIDANGDVTVVRVHSPPGGFDFRGLAYDFVSNVLWGFSRTTPCGMTIDALHFVPIDPTNGALLGPGFYGKSGLSAPNTAKSCEVGLWAADPTHYALYALHETGVNDTVVVYDLGVPGPSSPSSFCTAGVTTNGCLAQMSASSLNPSLLGLYDASPVVTVSNVEGNKSGLVFYGASGTVAFPWGSGFLCVKAPYQRTPAQFTGGISGTCTGMMSLDIGAYLDANPAALGVPFGLGQSMWMQGWFRDPPAPKTTNLSDALQITWLP